MSQAIGIRRRHGEFRTIDVQRLLWESNMDRRPQDRSPTTLRNRSQKLFYACKTLRHYPKSSNISNRENLYQSSQRSRIPEHTLDLKIVRPYLRFTALPKEQTNAASSKQPDTYRLTSDCLMTGRVPDTPSDSLGPFWKEIDNLREEISQLKNKNQALA